MEKDFLSFYIGDALLNMEVFNDEQVTWDPSRTTGSVSLSNGNLSVALDNAGSQTVRSSVLATEPKSSGKWYWEVTLTNGNAGMIGVNIPNTLENRIIGYHAIGQSGGRFVRGVLGNSQENAIAPSQLAAVNDVIGIALDIDNGRLRFFRNGIQILGQADVVFLNNLPSVGYEDGSVYYPVLQFIGVNFITATYTTNFGSTPFRYNPPEGFLPYNSRESEPILYVLLEIGENTRLSASGNIEDNALFTWSSDDNRVATVDVGLVTAVGVGTTQIHARRPEINFDESVNVRVVPVGGAAGYRLAHTLYVGEYIRLGFSRSKGLIFIDENRAGERICSDINTQATFTSMDTSVARVDSTGKVTGVSRGLAIITAELNGHVDQAYVRVI